jgi:Ala-tRNA(Pro) deacylase
MAFEVMYDLVLRRRSPVMPVQKLKEFLDNQNIRYMAITHSRAYTAQGIAALTHISGKELAKTVILKIDDALAMAVLPASNQVDLPQLKAAIGAETVTLASETEFKDRFPDCETGAMPPFGNLYDMTVLAEESLTRDKEIAFNAGTHSELIRLSWDDFVRLVRPRVLKFSSVRVGMTAA